MTVRPRSNYYIVFSVPERRRYVTDDGSISSLFVGNTRRGSFSRVEEVWVFCCHPDCPIQLKPGVKAYVSDAFELEPTDLDLTDRIEGDAAFNELRDFSSAVEGGIKTRLVHWDSLMAFEE